MYSNVFKTSEGAKKAWLTRQKNKAGTSVPAKATAAHASATAISDAKHSGDLRSKADWLRKANKGGYERSPATTSAWSAAVASSKKLSKDAKGSDGVRSDLAVLDDLAFKYGPLTYKSGSVFKEETMTYAHIFKAAGGHADGPKPTPFTKAKENKKTGKNKSVTLDHKNTGVDDPHRQPKKMSPGITQAKKSEMALMQGRIARDLGLLR